MEKDGERMKGRDERLTEGEGSEIRHKEGEMEEGTWKWEI